MIDTEGESINIYKCACVCFTGDREGIVSSY